VTDTTIDARAVIDPAADIGVGVVIDAGCIIGPGVVVGDGCRIGAHAVLQGPTRIGAGTEIHPMASVGGPPQDLKYDGEETHLEVGERNTIREFVTLNRGTASGGGVTRIGDDNLFMAYAHVGHDSQVGSRTVFANAATLAGHVEVGDEAWIGAYSGVHQFCRVARHAFIGGYSVVTKDALPWVTTVGNRAKATGLNLVGLKRNGYAPETIAALKSCYRTLFQSKMLLKDALDTVLDEFGHVEEVRYFVDFTRSSKRGVCR
jgi:UDP-N-acetylglucosamine acyltransferase